MEPSATERLIGQVGVDSGIVVVGDPAYLINADSPENVDWQSVVRKIFDPDNPQHIDGTTATEVAGTIMARTPTGDDLYPVYAEVDAEGRVTSIRVDLSPLGT